MRTLCILLTLIVVLLSCKRQKKNLDRKEKSIDLSRSVTRPGVVHVKSIGMDFIVKDTLNSGWNTFKYTNESTEVHFILMDLYPEGKNARNTKNEVLPPFEEGMKLIMNNDMESAVTAFGKLPAWFQEIKYMGGTGLISPNKTAISTIYLEPGLYIMECYVKMADGTWHTSHGMYKEIIVTGPNTDLAPPIETVAIEISSKAGILVADNIPKGKQVFKVTFRDQSTHEHFLGHDVNLVKYDTTASLDSLVHWMNWMNPRGLRTPVPKGFTFLGGMNNLPSGKHGYFDADLSPGNYVLISEVPKANEKNMMYKFKIK